MTGTLIVLIIYTGGKTTIMLNKLERIFIATLSWGWKVIVVAYLLMLWLAATGRIG